MYTLLILLRNVRVENANAIAGLTWGFPAVSNFLGFVHAISRELPEGQELELEGCGIICHSHQVLAYKPRGRRDYIFSLTRNPLTNRRKILDFEKGTPPSFIEEGRMHMTVSLIIPCLGELRDEIPRDILKEQITQLALSRRLAGGTISNIGAVEIIESPESSEELRMFERRQLRKLLPGFALVQRLELLAQQNRRRIDEDPDTEPIEAWLDFSALKYRAKLPEGVIDSDVPAEWHHVPKPAQGWLVPMVVGYRGISKLYNPGDVRRARDNDTPFRFVESIYSIGEWISPHRINSLQQLIWRYSADSENGWYLCRNTYQPSMNERI